MYTINGIELDNKAMGWRLLRSSLPLPEYGNRLVSIERGGRDGVTPFSSTRDILNMMFQVESTSEGLPALLSLFNGQQVLVADSSRPGKVAEARLVSATPETYNPVPNRHRYGFLLEIHGSSWRSATTTTTTLLPFDGTSKDIFSGISTSIQDAIIRFKGPATNPQLLDTSSGAFVLVEGNIAANQYVRFYSENGRAWLTSTDTWSGGNEATGDIDYGGYRGVFELTPKQVGSNPSTRTSTVIASASSSGSGSGVQIRGRNAYLY